MTHVPLARLCCSTKLESLEETISSHLHVPVVPNDPPPPAPPPPPPPPPVDGAAVLSPRIGSRVFSRRLGLKEDEVLVGFVNRILYVSAENHLGFSAIELNSATNDHFDLRDTPSLDFLHSIVAGEGSFRRGQYNRQALVDR